MKMPDGDAAIVDRQKLTGYCLNPEHPRGKHKARVFATFGFTAENAETLRAALLMAAASGDAQPAASDQFGDRYMLERFSLVLSTRSWYSWRAGGGDGRGVLDGFAHARPEGLRRGPVFEGAGRAISRESGMGRRAEAAAA